MTTANLIENNKNKQTKSLNKKLIKQGVQKECFLHSQCTLTTQEEPERTSHTVYVRVDLNSKAAILADRTVSHSDSQQQVVTHLSAQNQQSIY